MELHSVHTFVSALVDLSRRPFYRKYTPTHYKHVFKMATRGKHVGKGIRLNSQSKEIILNVYEYFQKIHAKGKAKGPFQRTLDATGFKLLLFVAVMY